MFGLLLAFLIIPTQIKYVDTDWYNSPRFFPYVVAGLFVVLGVTLFFSGRKKSATMRDEAQEVYAFPWEKIKMLLITLVILAAYVFAMEFLPYIPCTIVALAVMMIVYKQRNWLTIGIVSVAVPLVIYFSFTYLLKLRMP